MDLHDYSAPIEGILRFEAHVVSAYPKGVKSVEQAKQDRIEPTRPFQVRFGDGARWVSRGDTAVVTRRLDEAIQSALSVPESEVRETLKQILQSPIDENDAREVRRMVDRLRGYQVDRVVVRMEGENEVIGLNPGWSVWIDEEIEAVNLAKRLSKAMERFRLSALNAVRCDMLEAIQW